ncbi:unnamed protein product [Rotaria magnacalcarata]
MIESGEILNNSLAATHRIQPGVHRMNALKFCERGDTLNALTSYQKALECSHQEKSPSDPSNISIYCEVSNLQNDADVCLTYSMVGHLLEEQRNPLALPYYEHALEIGLKLKTKMANLTEMLTNSQVRYSHESDAANSVDALSITYCEDTATTKSPIQPESAQTRVCCHSCSSHSRSFPYEPTTRIDDRLREITLKYEIRQELGEHLRGLEDYEIIVVCDDSGSMKTTVDGTNRTRWDELCEIVKIILEIGVVFDSSGVDLFFLNRRSFSNVKDPEQVNQIFSNQPRGYTPLVSALQNIFQLPATRRGYDKKVLIFIATDGAPTDDNGNINVQDLEHVMNVVHQIETTHVMFLLCTDDPTCVAYLNEWKNTMANVDVTDDYRTERDKVQRRHGLNAPFSIGDYIVKALVGARDVHRTRFWGDGRRKIRCKIYNGGGG